jgi:hypothetical protein
MSGGSIVTVASIGEQKAADLAASEARCHPIWPRGVWGCGHGQDIGLSRPSCQGYEFSLFHES